MQRLLSKLPNLSVNTTSKHPTATDSVHIQTTLSDESPSTSASNNAERPRSVSGSSSTSRIDSPFVTDVIIKHNSAFNSERESGMSKLQQLQFVELLKGMILDQASIVTLAASGFRIITARKSNICPAPPTSFCNAAVYIATLIGSPEGGGAMVVEQSEECEYLADAVEDLWEKVLVKVGEETEGLKVGELIAVEDAAFERVESGETLVVSER